MARLFGTDGVRGVSNEKLTGLLAFKLGFAGAKVLAKNPKNGVKPVILIGMDTRISGKMLEAGLAAGITSAGADVIEVGVVPTPGVAYLTKKYNCDAGVMISASHNSFEYNGIKFFSGDGYKLSDATEDEIEEIISNFDKYYTDLPTHGELGNVDSKDSLGDEYVDYLRSCITVDAKGLKIAIDCANGASSAFAEGLFSSMGAEVIMLGNTPDGVNINKDCGSTHMEMLSETVVSEGCSMGFAFDGDADRFLCVDSTGAFVDGDVIMSIIANAMKDAGTLAGDTLVVTVMSNLGVDIMAKQKGISLAKTKVGDRYVLEEMRKSGFNIGGEQSGHVILSDYSTTGDGMLSALALLKALSQTGKTLDEAKTVVTVLPQVLKKAKVKDSDKENAMKSEALLNRIKELEEVLGTSGRILVRASGTEPIIRVMLEGTDVAQISAMADELVAIIDKEFGEA